MTKSPTAAFFLRRWLPLACTVSFLLCVVSCGGDEDTQLVPEEEYGSGAEEQSQGEEAGGGDDDDPFGENSQPLPHAPPAHDHPQQVKTPAQSELGGKDYGGKAPAQKSQANSSSSRRGEQMLPDRALGAEQRRQLGRSNTIRLAVQKDGVQNTDMLWVVDNGFFMKYWASHRYAQNIIRTYVDQYSQVPGVRSAVVTALSKKARLCVPRILLRNEWGRRNRDYGFRISSLKPRPQLSLFDCEVESLATLSVISSFIKVGLAGVKSDGFFRPAAFKAFVVISNAHPLQAHIAPFQSLLSKKFHPALISFSSVSSAEPYPKKTRMLGEKSKLAPPYADYKERSFYARCGHLYSPTFSHLTENLGGITAPICANNPTAFLKKLTDYIDVRRRGLFVLGSLEGQNARIEEVSVQGRSLPAKDFEVISQGSAAPLLWIKKPQLGAESEIEVRVSY